MKKLIFLTIIIVVVSCNAKKQKPRFIIASIINSMGDDPDDKQSMAHLLMYAYME